MKLILAAALLAGSLTGAAQAMPLAPLSTADTAAVIEVAQGCGPGAYRNRFGECRRDFRGPPPRYGYGYAPPPPRYVAPRYVEPRVVVRCPPGMFPGRGGACYPRY